MAWLCVRFYLSQVWNGGNRKVFMLFRLTRFHFAPILRNFVFVKSKRATRKKWFKNNSLKLKMGLFENRLYGNGCFLNRLWNIRVIVTNNRISRFLSNPNPYSRIHVWYIYLHLFFFFRVNVGKYAIQKIQRFRKTSSYCHITIQARSVQIKTTRCETPVLSRVAS